MAGKALPISFCFLLSAGALAGCSHPLRVRVLGGASCPLVQEASKQAGHSQLAWPPNLAQSCQILRRAGELEFGATAGSAAFVPQQKQGLTGSALTPAQAGRKEGASLCADISLIAKMPPRMLTPITPDSNQKESRVLQTLRTTVAQIEGALLLVTVAFSTLV